MDTTSNALSRTLQMLSKNTEVQAKLRAEIVEAHGAERLDYDSLNKIPYLDAICRETLRLYSPGLIGLHRRYERLCFDVHVLLGPSVCADSHDFVVLFALYDVVLSRISGSHAFKPPAACPTL